MMTFCENLFHLLLSTVFLLTYFPANVHGELQLFPKYTNNEMGLKPSDTVAVTCEGTDIPKNKKLAWKHKGFIIQGTHFLATSSTVPPDSTGDRLKLKLNVFGKMARLNSTTYNCCVVDKKSKIGSSVDECVNLKVRIFEDVIFTGNRSFRTAKDKPARLTCNVHLDRKYKTNFILWQRNGITYKQENGSRFNIIEKKDRLDRVTSSTLIINNLQKSDEGNYTCRTFPGHSLTSDSDFVNIQLQIEYKPTIIPGLTSTVWVDKNKMGIELVKITCIVDANPTATISWKVQEDKRYQGSLQKGKEEELNNKKDYLIPKSIWEKEEDNKRTITVKLDASKLVTVGKGNNKYRTKRLDYKFICIATNPHGKARMEFKIRKGEKPKKPRLLNYRVDEGKLLLEIQEIQLNPVLDYYLITTESNYTILFNTTQGSNPMKPISWNTYAPYPHKTYEIDLTQHELPATRELASLMSHNALGFSEATNETENKPRISFMIGFSARIMGTISLMASSALFSILYFIRFN